MRVIDYSEFDLTDGKLSFGDRISGSFRYGFSWPRQMESQQKAIDYLNKVLGNRFTILRNYTLPEIEIPIPLILIGPSGITVIVVSSLAGIFRAKYDSWMQMDNRARKFKPAKPNLITETQLMSKVVSRFLTENSIHIDQMEGVLVFTHPGTHVDAIRPAVRVILVDAIDRFATQLNQTRQIFTVEDVRKVVELFDTRHQDDVQGEDGIAAGNDFSEREPNALEKVLFRLGNIFNFNRRQWLTLFGLIFVELCAIVIFITVIFYTVYF